MAKKTDEIIKEIRRHREEHAASFDFDMRRIVEDLQRQERESGRKVVSRSPRKPLPIKDLRVG